MARPDYNAAFDTYASSLTLPDPNEAFDRFASGQGGQVDPNEAFDSFQRNTLGRDAQGNLKLPWTVSTPERSKFFAQRPELLQNAEGPRLPDGTTLVVPDAVKRSLGRSRKVTGSEAAERAGLTRPQSYQRDQGKFVEDLTGEGAPDALSRVSQRFIAPVAQSIFTPEQGAAPIPRPWAPEDLRELLAPQGESQFPTFREVAGLQAPAPFQQGGHLVAPESGPGRMDREIITGLAEMLNPLDPQNILMEAGGGVAAVDKLGGKIGNFLRFGDDLGKAFEQGMREGARELGRPANFSRELPEIAGIPRGGRGPSAYQLQRELRQAQGSPEDLLDEDARFNYEEDAAPQTPLKSKSIAQMRAEMRNPIPPPGPRSASQLRAEMSKAADPNEAFDAFAKTLPEANPDLPIARPIQADLREAAMPQRELSLPNLTPDQMDELRALPDVQYPAPEVDHNAAFDEFAKRIEAAPEPVATPKAEPAPAVTPKAELPAWQKPTTKNVARWQKAVSEADSQLEARVQKAVSEAGGDESSWRAHYREMEPSSVKHARANLATAQTAPSPAPTGPVIDPAIWSSKSTPGAIPVRSGGRTINVRLSTDEISAWRWQTPAERRAAIEERALAAQPVAKDVPTYRPAQEVGDDAIARELGLEPTGTEGDPGRQLREFRERRAQEQPPTPEQQAKSADRAARQDEFHRRSLELVQAHTPIPSGKGRLKPGELEMDHLGRPYVDMGQRRYWLTEGEARYYNDLPPDVDKAEWLKLRQHEPKAPRYRAANALPEGQVEIPETAVDELIPEGSPLKGKPAPPERPRVPEPVAERAPEPQPARKQQAPEDQGRLESLDPDEILTDAKTYQFKEGGDAQGVTDRLRDVPKWDPVLSGKVVVHERLDGSRYIADGHQRLGLAKRAKAAGQDGVRLDAQVFREADGWTAGEVRKIAALKNIAEGSGTAIDAAKVIREAGLSEPRLKNIPRTSAVMRDGEQLAKLSDPAFESVVNGTVKPEQAAHVGRLISDPAEQMATLKALRKYAPKTSAEAESIVQDLRVAGFAKKNEGLPPGMEQGGLFGDEELFQLEDLLGERAKVMDGAARRIKDDKALFNKLVKGEGRASEAGNVLDRAANEARLSDDEQILRALEQSKYVGPVADALNSAALGLRNGKKVEAATDEFLAAIREELGRSGGLGSKPGRPPVEPPGKGPRVGLDFEPDAPTGKPATGWDSPRPPESIGNRKLTAEQKENWPWMTAAERKEMLGAKPAGPKVGMDFQPEQLELGYKVGGEDVKLGQVANVKELPLPALVRFVKETTGNYPKIQDGLRALGKKLGGTVRGRVVGRSIELNPDLFENLGQFLKVAAHEIGHLPDIAPWAKGVAGGIGDLRKGMRTWLKSLPAEARRELWEVSKHWRPIDEARASAKQLRYRKDVEETFADSISMLFNHPEDLQKRAPKFWKEFTGQLDRAPKLKQAIADVHAWRSGTLQDLTTELRQQIRGDMIRGADLMAALQAEAKQREQSLLFRLHQNWGQVETGFLDTGGVYKAWADRLERQGIPVPEHLDPRIHYDAYQFHDGRTVQVAKHANEKILQPLREAGVDEHLAGEWIKNQAIADGHRAKVANSRGVSEKEAREALRQIEAQLSPEQLRAVKGAAQEARTMFVDALREARDAGRLDAATFDRISKLKDLTPQLELENLHAKLEDVVASIETGSFAEASNPLVGMVQQTLAIRGEARRNKARQVMLDFVKSFAPEEVTTAGGRARVGSADFSFYRDGVKETHRVDRYLEDLFEVTSTRELEGIAKAADSLTGGFQKVWLRWNPGFYAAQGVMDLFKSARNLSAVGLYNAWGPTNVLRVAKSWREAFGAALDYARQVPNDVISRMIEEQAILPADLSLTNQLAGDALAQTGQLEQLISAAGVNTRRALDQGNYFRKVAGKLGDFWTSLGRFSEALPKVAAWQELEKSGKFSAQYRANIVRTKIGQPGNYVRGKFTRSSNRLFTFSNTIIQDMRSNWHLIRRPSTRGGFALQMLKQSMLPKLLIGGAAAGWFGKELAEAYAAIPERDKRNSIPIPIGVATLGLMDSWEEGGEFGKRVHYINIPTDPTDRLFGALFYEALWGSEKEAQDRLKVVGETLGSSVPEVNPTIKSGENLLKAVFGGTPEDGFGREILSRDEAQAGVGSRRGGYLRWQVGEFGMPGQALQGAIWNEDLGQRTEWAPANIPFLSRFLKSSDAGFAEKQRAGELAEDRGKARSRLAQGDATRELRSQFNRLGGLGSRTPQQQKAYQDLKSWHAMYDQQTQWINMLEARGQKDQAEAARQRLEMISGPYMDRFQATTGKRWK